MTAKSTSVLKFITVISWVIFIGLCITAGGILFNTFFTLVINPIAVKSFWEEVDLSNLYNFDKGYFISETLLMSIVAVMKAILFYLIVKILHKKKLNLSQPFNIEIKAFISNASYLTLGIGLFSYWGIQNTKWLVTQGVSIPDIQNLGLGGADVWLFMGITLLVIAEIFKKGIALQSENELTI
ncbi:DUF2975 domain-containing protein [Flavobacterium jejuense]|uniref:DUF2975 domain-containing protein n=1 Tax=Flavobacterium jejuense TaxID=1544455 RepID=A0ABX0IQN8_9FLAO|nr:DUF2975 domain-containing protein [Flavobacterium jejuense]NHN24431.1 DUF2975 domain-containing protein [Flavobacterium jejuense]